jgi:hypothetical protein
MKRTILALCVLMALSSQADAAKFYKCIDKNGNKLLTNTTPPPGAVCESMGAQKDLTPTEAAAREIDRQSTAANDKVETLINQLMNDPKNLQTQNMGGGVIKTGGLKKNVLEKIVELRKAQLRSQGSTPNGNQQADMEDKMKRQQREMEDQQGRMNAEMNRQQAEMQRLQNAQRQMELQQRLQQINNAFK